MEKGTFQLGREDKKHCLAMSFHDGPHVCQVFAYCSGELPEVVN